MPRSLSTIRRISSVLLAWVAAMSGCSAKRTTELMVGVQADVRVPTDIDAVQFRVLINGVVVANQSAQKRDGALSLPGSFGVVAGSDPSEPVVIEVAGYARGNPMVLRRAQTTFVAGETLYLSMPLTFACYGASDCAQDRTCIAGSCVSASVDATTLPRFTSTEQFLGDGPGRDPDSCFEAETCLTATTALVASGSDGCTFVTPATGVGSFTPVLIYAPSSSGVGFCASSDGTCRVPVDHDAREGWDFTDATHAAFALVPGVCAKMKALDGQLEVATTCGDKTFARPVCASTASGGDSDAGPGGDDASSPTDSSGGDATGSTPGDSDLGCPSGDTLCAGADGALVCVDTNSDPDNCGTCGHACADCSAGKCPTTVDAADPCEHCLSVNCSAAMSACDGTCQTGLTCLLACSGDIGCEDGCVDADDDATLDAVTTCGNHLCAGACTFPTPSSDASVFSDGSTCSTTCASIGWMCGTATLCGVSTDCGSCPSGGSCDAGTCAVDATPDGGD